MKHIDYNNCITNLTSSIQKYFNVTPNYKTNELIDKYLQEKDYENVIVFVFDAMGNNVIDLNTTENSFLQKRRVGSMTSTFPPTTANCTTAYISGLNPIETGWLGWSTYYKDLDLVVDNFKNQNSITKETIEGDNIAYNKLPFKHMGMQIQEENKDVTYHVVMPSFAKGGCKSLKEFEHRICKICNQKGKKYIYAYWDQPDACMHHNGIKNDLVKKHLNQISKVLHNIERKTKNTIGIVSADHGMVDVTPIAIYTYYDILACLKAPISCDARCCFFFVKEDKKEEFINLFNQNFSEYYDIYSKEEILENHIFGNGKKYSQLDNILGDYIAIAKSNYYFLLSLNSHLFLAHHAGGLKEEADIPIIIIKN